jgi:hypothetical protein
VIPDGALAARNFVQSQLRIAYGLASLIHDGSAVDRSALVLPEAA